MYNQKHIVFSTQVHFENGAVLLQGHRSKSKPDTRFALADATADYTYLTSNNTAFANFAMHNFQKSIIKLSNVQSLFEIRDGPGQIGDFRCLNPTHTECSEPSQKTPPGNLWTLELTDNEDRKENYLSNEIGLKLVRFEEGVSMRTRHDWIVNARGRKIIEADDRILIFYEELNSQTNSKVSMIGQVCKQDKGPLRNVSRILLSQSFS